MSSGHDSSTATSQGWSQVLLVVRLLLGGLFVFSGAVKVGFFPSMGEVYDFALAIRSFKILDYDLIPFTAFVVPWVELVAGLFLLAGLRGSAAAQVINLMTILFTLAMFTVMARGIEADCGCFGKFLGMKVGWVAVGRNAVFIALATLVVFKGSGRYSLDALVAGKCDHAGCGC